MNEMTAEEYKKSLRPRHKFHAVTTVRDNIRFASRAEAGYYDRLKIAQEVGGVVGFLRQPLFDLGGGTKYRADFLVFYSDGTCEVIDVKGMETTAFKKAKKQVESLYPWIGEIVVVK